MRRTIAVLVLLTLAVLVSTIIYASAQDPAFWRTPDASVRMAASASAQSPATANEANAANGASGASGANGTSGERTRSAAQNVQREANRPEFHSTPAPSGITVEQIVMFCALITAVAAVLTRFVINPAIEKKFAAFKSAIDSLPNNNISRRENDLLEEVAKREHQLLAERITSLKSATEDQGKRLDVEFGKVWKVLQRMIDRLDRIERKPPSTM